MFQMKYFYYFVIFIIQSQQILISSNSFKSKDQNTDYQRSKEALAEYKQHSSRCKWKLRRERADWCNVEVHDCIVKATVEEGAGYYAIARYGPISTTGGIQNIFCHDKNIHVPSPGEWLTRAITAPFDPYTGDIIPFPPIHVHHCQNENHDLPSIPEELYNHMPWLSSAEEVTKPLSWITNNGADTQCLRDHGGTDCFMKLYPKGYGRKSYHKAEKYELILHIQDVRLDDSPLMTHYIESAQFYVTKMNLNHSPLLPIVDLSLFVGTEKPPFTYELKYNTSMIQYVTYYFSMSVNLVGTWYHQHSIAGDEGWLVRGTQGDLGIPPELQTTIHATRWEKKFGPIHDAIIINENFQMGKTLFEVKKYMEKSLQQHNEKLNNNDYSYQHDHHHHKDDIFEFIPFHNDSYNITYTNKVKPKILCKYFANTEILTLNDLDKQKQQWYDHYNLIYTNDTFAKLQRPIIKNHYYKELVNNGRYVDKRITNSKSIDNSFYIKSLPKKVKPLRTSVTAEEQGMNQFKTTLPGEYYRHMRKSQYSSDPEEARISHCDNVHIEAGEYITIVHFNEPRIRPDRSDIFDGTENVINQHMMFLTAAHVRGFPYQ